MIDCLNSGKTSKNMFEVIEGGKLTSTCIAGGSPLPFIQCFLLNKDKNRGQMTKRAQRNFTASNPIVFKGIHRRVVRIQCVLDGGHVARKKSVDQNVMVYCKCLLASNLFLP